MKLFCETLHIVFLSQSAENCKFHISCIEKCGFWICNRLCKIAIRILTHSNISTVFDTKKCRTTIYSGCKDYKKCPFIQGQTDKVFFDSKTMLFRVSNRLTHQSSRQACKASRRRAICRLFRTLRQWNSPRRVLLPTRLVTSPFLCAIPLYACAEILQFVRYCLISY